MDGHDYEYVVAAYLRNKGYNRVKVTKGSGDFGVDVIAHMGGKKYAVQCKYYTSPVSLGAVQEAVAGKAMYGCNAAMVVTNSTFTKAAEELAKQNGVVLISKVNSTGFTFRGFFKRIITIGIVLIALLLLLCTAVVIDTVKDQFQAGMYKVAVSNIFSLILLYGIVIGVPICLKILFKHLKIKAKTKFEGWKNKRVATKAKPAERLKIQQVDCGSVAMISSPVATKPDHKEMVTVNIPEGFAKYQNLTSNKVEEYSFAPTQKNREEMIQALRVLRKEDFDAYSHLYEILKPVFEEGRSGVSIGYFQRRMKIGFNRASRIVDILVDIGFVLPSVDYNLESLVVTEQEVVDLLTEVENNPAPIEFDCDKTASASRKLKANNTACNLDSFKLSNDTQAMDPLLYDAMKVFLRNDRTSIGLIQRELRIGFERAARIVDCLEDFGFITSFENGKKGRFVLVTEQEFEKWYAEIKNNPT